MRTAFPALLLLAFLVESSAQTPATITYGALPGAALYSDGYLFSWNSPQYTEITFYGRDAQAAYTVPADKHGGVYHVGWAVDSDGVAVGVYQPRQVWEGRIDLLDASGKRIRTIDTGSYISQRIVFAPDHTLWTVGFIAGNDGSKGDFNVLRRYARTGQELGEALPWSQIAGDHNSYTALQPIGYARPIGESLAQSYGLSQGENHRVGWRESRVLAARWGSDRSPVRTGRHVAS